MGALARPRSAGRRDPPPAEGAVRRHRRRGAGRGADQRARPRDRGADRAAAGRRSRVSSGARSRPGGFAAPSRRCSATARPSSTSGRPSWPRSRSSFALARRAVREQERDIAVRKQELGAVELRRAAVERREEAAAEREAALEHGRGRAARREQRARRPPRSSRSLARRTPLPTCREPEARAHLLYLARRRLQARRARRAACPPGSAASRSTDERSSSRGSAAHRSRATGAPCAYLEPARATRPPGARCRASGRRRSRRRRRRRRRRARRTERLDPAAGLTDEEPGERLVLVREAPQPHVVDLDEPPRAAVDDERHEHRGVHLQLAQDERLGAVEIVVEERDRPARSASRAPPA